MKPQLNCLYIYLTDECNMNCIHCWQSAPMSGSGKYSSLNFDQCKNFLESAIKMGLKSVIFSGGEPLLNSDFHLFTEFLSAHSVSMSIETNGLLLADNRVFRSIRDHNVRCSISIDGAIESTHNKQRGRNDAFQVTCSNIDKLESEKIGFQLLIAISKLNYHELVPLLDDIKKKWKYCNSVKINIVNMLGRGREMEQKGLLFSPDELPKVTEDVAEIIGKYPFKLLLHIDPVFFSFKNLLQQYCCGGHCGFKSSLSILSNGCISICSLGKQIDKYVFGHVTSVSLEDLWENHPMLNEIHESTHQKIAGICSNCIFRKKCLGGCRAEALWVYGDFFAPNPVCQNYYDSGKFPVSRLINPSIKVDYKKYHKKDTLNNVPIADTNKKSRR